MAGLWERTSFRGGPFLVTADGVKSYDSTEKSDSVTGVVMELKSADTVLVTCLARRCRVGTSGADDLINRRLKRGETIGIPASARLTVSVAK